MTDDEKNIVKQMNRLLLDLAYVKAVYEGVLGTQVRDWRAQVEAANAAPEFQQIRRVLEEARQAIDLLVDRGQMTSAIDRLPRDLVN